MCNKHLNSKAKERHGVNESKTYRLTDEELSMLDEIVRQWGCVSQNAAIKRLIREEMQRVKRRQRREKEQQDNDQ